MRFALSHLGYKTKEDLYENLYLEAFIDTYRRIDKHSLLENKIRDDFVYDFEYVNPLTSDLIQQGVITLNWERRLNVSEEEKRRADISFSISGLGFIIECKRLASAESKYLDEGIKRFIDLKYGKSDSHGGMVAFVIGGNIKKIAEIIKSKVKEFYFTIGCEDLLEKKCLSWEYSFQSRHDRINNTQIHLYHLFFDFITKS
jgi:hypothetical protein